ncbi:hypothetical protein Trydic_g5699 [Trypoxylus dichotomus]
MYYISSFCHLCLKDDKHLINLSKGLPENTTFVSKLNICVSEVEWSTSNPLLTCKSCLEKLELAYEFKQTCIQSNGILTQYLRVLEAKENSNKPVRSQLKVVLSRKSIANMYQVPAGTPIMVYNPTSLILTNGQQISYQNMFLNFVATNSPSTSGKQQLLMNIVPQNNIGATENDITLKNLLEASKPVELNCEVDPDLYDVDHFLVPPVQVTTPNIECKICGYSYITYKQLRKHFNLVHDGNLPYSCSFCFASFLVEDQYDKHMKTHVDIYDDGVAESSITLDDFVKPNQTNTTVQGNTAEDFECFKCSELFLSFESYSEHITDVHKLRKPKRDFIKGMKKAMCPICNKDLSTQSYLNKHMRLMHPSGEQEQITNKVAQQKVVKKVTCNICQKEFCTQWYLQHHMKTHEQNGNTDEQVEGDAAKKDTINIISEDSNSSDVQSSDDLKTMDNNNINANDKLKKGNLIMASSEERVKCRFCEKLFPKSILRRHMNIKHINSTRYKCHLCGDQFDAFHLVRHLKGHYSSLSCSVCRKIFSSIPDITTHMSDAHTEPKPITCEVCSASFDDIPELRMHMEKHLSDIVYKCHRCEEEFAECRLLIKHVREHDGMKTCDNCKRYYYSEEEFLAHKPACDEGNHKCDVCQKGFLLKHALKVHMRSEHSDKFDTDEPQEKRSRIADEEV